MGERYPDGNWRENRRLYRVIRGFITERRLAGNNEILAERHRDFVR